MTDTLTLPQLLDRLGYEPGEHVSINDQAPGRAFSSRIIDSSRASSAHPADADMWFGVNPVAPSTSGRGGAADVTRLAAVYADLDIKPGGVADLPAALEIISDLSDMLGTRPVAITFSGHGAQPFWAVEDHPVTDENRTDAKGLLRRFGRLVASVAAVRGADVDSVFDLARVLRIPGTVNHKQTPVPVVTAPDQGRPLSVEEIADTLDAYGVPALSSDTEELGVQVSNPDEWTWASSTCGYAASTIKAWAKESPDGRHPWLVSSFVRLAAMHAHGCITEADHAKARGVLTDRFTHLLATSSPARDAGRGEIAEAFSWGVARASTMSAERVARELGDHDHVEPGHLVAAPASTSPTTTDGNLATVHDFRPAQTPNLALVTERTLAHSDDANALALIDAYGEHLRFCSDRGRWYAWDGHTWKECPRTTGVAREYAKRIARALPESDKGEIAHKKRSLSAVGITAMLTQAATDDRVAVTYDQLDAHPWELNTPGGIIDLRTGDLHPADPDKLHTRSTLCTPDFTADRTVWLSFLRDTFGDDDELIAYVQRLVGYSAVGIVGPHVLPFAFGSGGNGKGVFLETPMKVLGDYATTAPAGFLMARKHAAHETETARLSGARMVLCSEVNEDDKFDEAKVKQLTGGDTLTARFMHQDHFTFTPTHQLWLMGNHQPTVRSGGRSFWRRLRLIPFLKEVAAENVVDDLQGILARDHGPAILAWIIEGAVAYCRDGLNEPKSVLAATQEYAHDQDTVARFVEESCHLDGVGVAKEKVSTVREAYERWCHANGETAVTPKALGMALSKLGVDSTRTKHARMYAGITVLTTDEDASPDVSSLVRSDLR